MVASLKLGLVVALASIALAGCGHLDLLVEVFDAVHVPEAVLKETTADHSRPGAADIVAFVRAYAKVHPSRDDGRYAAVATYLDEGEAQALSLAHALRCGVLMDERRGRQAAARQGVKLYGVLGVLLQMGNENPGIRPLIGDPGNGYSGPTLNKIVFPKSADFPGVRIGNLYLTILDRNQNGWMSTFTGTATSGTAVPGPGFVPADAEARVAFPGSNPPAVLVAVRVGRHDGVVSVIEALKGHPLFAHITLTRSERSAVAALVTELLDGLS